MKETDVKLVDLAYDVRGISSCASLVGHIILCGQLRGLNAFLRPLRAVTRQPVVYLHPELPDVQDLEAMDAYDNVFFCEGSPLEVEDLKSAGATTATMVIIFADTGYFLSHEGREADTFATAVACSVEANFSCKWLVEMVDG